MSFKELLMAAKSGNAEAMEQLINMYKPLITRYSFFNDVFDEDLHQEQLLKFVHCVKLFSEKFPENVTKLPKRSVIRATSDNQSDELPIGRTIKWQRRKKLTKTVLIITPCFF